MVSEDNVTVAVCLVILDSILQRNISIHLSTLGISADGLCKDTHLNCCMRIQLFTVFRWK